MARITEREFAELDARLISLHELVTITMVVLCNEKPFSTPQTFIGMLEVSMTDLGHSESTVAHLKQIKDWLTETLQVLEVQP